ncbi:MAG: protein translocase subunit SecD [Opitutales bacterium]|nr:protein translocase subunit SecD [Opitutales bacterium]
MKKRIIWKLVVSAMLIAWSVMSLIPVNDIDFAEYLETEVSANYSEFQVLLDEARTMISDDKEVNSVYVALSNLVTDQKLDLRKFFPHINLRDIKNIERSNEILLKHLLATSRGKIKKGLDLQGGVSFTLQVDQSAIEGKESYELEEQLSKAIEIMEERVNGLGVSEPVIRAVGDSRIEIQIPGLSVRENPQVIDALKKPARLEFRLVHRDRAPSGIAENDIPPAGYEKLIMEREDHKTGEVQYIPYYVKRVPEATGEIVARSVPTMDETGGFKINMTFTDEGSDRFAKITRMIEDENRRREQETGASNPGQLAIVLDGILHSAPTVREEIRGGGAEISGDFTQREAIELSNVLNNPLAVELEVAEMYEVGPSLAEDARDASIRAALLGGSLVMIFMVAYYGIGGIVAVISVAINLVILLGVLASFGATMTLPGVAGVVLTIGMAVDANILIFERIREELRAGKSTINALRGGYEKALSTIVDANVTTLITSMILIWMGSGPIKGFGVTLAIGIGGTLFCSLIVSRLVLEVLVEGLKVNRILGFTLLGNTAFDFMKFRVPAFIVSWSIVLIGFGHLIYSHDHIFGIDFVGGDELSVEFSEKIAMSDFQAIAEAENAGEVSAVYQTLIGDNKSIIKIQTEVGQGNRYFDALHAAFPDAGLKLIGENTIGASVSQDIQRQAVLSVLVALMGILLYVALRFEVGYGVGAVISLVHDLFMTLGIFVFVGGQFTAPMIAAVLMVIGYSINDTIVVFDRIREELGLRPGMSLYDVIKLSINATLGRSILTSFTTFISALALYIFGAGVITDFAFIFMTGIITGTFSSIFIASPIFYWWHKGDRKHVEERELLPKYEWQSSSKAAD